MLEEVDLGQTKATSTLGALRASSPLRRIATYRGLLKELGFTAFNVALWPVGFIEDALRTGAERVPLRRSNPPTAPPRLSKSAAQAPVLLIHGYFHNRSGFLIMRRALRKQGFKNVVAYTYNPLGKSIPELAVEVGERVTALASDCGTDKVNIVGHSLGGIMARYWIEHLGGAGKVSKLITLGTPHHGTATAFLSRAPAAKQLRPNSEVIKALVGGSLASDVEYISYYSNLDGLVIPSDSAVLEGDGPNVRNILVRDLGHLSLLLNRELIDSIALNLSDPQPGLMGA